MDSCFGHFRPRQHGIASKQAQVPKTNISNGKSAVLLGCGYKDVLGYTNVLVANLKPLRQLLLPSTLYTNIDVFCCIDNYRQQT